MFDDLSRRSLLTKSKPPLTGKKKSYAKVANDRFEDIMIWCIKITMPLSCRGSLVIYKSKPHTMDLPWVLAQYTTRSWLSPYLSSNGTGFWGSLQLLRLNSTVSVLSSLFPGKAHLKLQPSQLSRWLCKCVIPVLTSPSAPILMLLFGVSMWTSQHLRVKLCKLDLTLPFLFRAPPLLPQIQNLGAICYSSMSWADSAPTRPPVISRISPFHPMFTAFSQFPPAWISASASWLSSTLRYWEESSQKPS